MDVGSDRDPSAVCLINGWEQGGTRYLGSDWREQARVRVQEVCGAGRKIENGVRRQMLQETKDNWQFIITPGDRDRVHYPGHTLLPVIGLP